MTDSRRTGLPDYDSLPEAEAGGRTAWGLFGINDNLGLINLQTADRIRDAARLIRKGSVFALNAPVDLISHPLFGRGRPRHSWKTIGDIEFDDWLDNFYLQGSTQWDSLGHYGYLPNRFYNGADLDSLKRGERNTIEHWARRGIVGRAILLDVARALAERGREFSPAEPYPITVDDLEIARQQANVSYEPGDIWLIRTGYLTWYETLSDPQRRALAENGDPPSAGLAHSESIARYIWNSHASAIAADNTSLEVTPADMSEGGQPFGLLHTVLIGLFGLAVGELWWLEDLATDCANDGVHEMFLTSSPIHLRGGFGSPANAIAVK